MRPNSEKESAALQALEEQICKVRNRMQQLWDEKGYTDGEILNTSIELDGLLNKHRQMAKQRLKPGKPV